MQVIAPPKKTGSVSFEEKIDDEINNGKPKICCQSGYNPLAEVRERLSEDQNHDNTTGEGFLSFQYPRLADLRDQVGMMKLIKYLSEQLSCSLFCLFMFVY
jgi:hypothetical protein